MTLQSFFYNAKQPAGYLLGTVAFGICLYFAWWHVRDPILNVLLCLAGGTAGWILGILVTPRDETEEQQFSDFGKAFLALGSGVAIGKVDVLLGPIVARGAADGQLLIQGLLVFVCLGLGLLFVFIGRKSPPPEDDVLKERRTKHLKEMKETLAKLEADCPP